MAKRMSFLALRQSKQPDVVDQMHTILENIKQRTRQSWLASWSASSFVVDKTFPWKTPQFKPSWKFRRLCENGQNWEKRMRNFQKLLGRCPRPCWGAYSAPQTPSWIRLTSLVETTLKGYFERHWSTKLTGQRKLCAALHCVAWQHPVCLERRHSFSKNPFPAVREILSLSSFIPHSIILWKTLSSSWHQFNLPKSVSQFQSLLKSHMHIWDLFFNKQIHTYTSNILIGQRPDRNVVAQSICCWWMCGFAWWLWFPSKNHHWFFFIFFSFVSSLSFLFFLS